MPCNDGMDAYYREQAAAEKIEAAVKAATGKHITAQAVLCGIVRILGDELVMDMVNWTEAGVTKEQFQQWWAEHQALDAQRKAKG